MKTHDMELTQLREWCLEQGDCRNCPMEHDSVCAIGRPRNWVRILDRFWESYLVGDLVALCRSTPCAICGVADICEEEWAWENCPCEWQDLTV